MNKNFPPDSFLSGLVLGSVTLTLLYYTLTGFNTWWKEALHHNEFLQRPRPQLIILAVTMLMFRYMIVVSKKHETAKGYFFVLFVMTIYYMISTKYRLSPTI